MNDFDPRQPRSSEVENDLHLASIPYGVQASAQTIRMLHVVGGRGMAERVDVSDLFATRLAAKGYRIDWVLFAQDPGPAWLDTTWRGAKAYVVGVSSLAGIRGSIVSKFYELAADLRVFWMILRHGYDIVQVRDRFLVGAFARLAAKIRGSKFTYWMSYPFAECRIVDAQEGRARIPALSIAGGRLAAWMLYRVILPGADHIFVQSRQMLKDVSAHGIDSAKMTPVPMGVSENLLQLPPLPVDANTIVYLGTLNLVRRLDTLVDALAIVRKTVQDAKLIFIGDGDVPEDRARLEAAIAANGLDAAVEITGWLPMREAHERVRRAAVCLSPFYPTPILLSTSPTKLIEYMALGRPVVANEHPEQSLIISESRAGICVPWSAEEFARAIAAILADPSEAKAMGVRGRDYVRETRLYPQIAETVDAEYVRLMRTS